MKVKTVLKSLLFAYAFTGVLLLLLAFLLFSFDLGENAVLAGIAAVYILSCFMGGFMAGRIMRSQKYLWGILVACFYFLLLLVVSFAAEGKWDMEVGHMVSAFLMCLAGGSIGGMLS